MQINNDIITKITSLVKDAGKIVCSAHEVENTSNIDTKYGTANFVTEFDVKVQNFLINGLSEITPEAVFFAEEKQNCAEDISKKLCYVIDPIDGTSNFIHDLRASAISVGLLFGGKPVFGVIYDPYRDEMFYASAGEGAYMNGKPISVSDRPLEKALVAFGTAPYDREKLGELTFGIAKSIYFRCGDLRRTGAAAIDLCNVACGRMDAFFEPLLSPWDYAAGSLILQEAGGSITDFSGENIKYEKPGSVLCSNGKTHKQLLEIIKNSEE